MDFDLTPDQRDLQQRARALTGDITARAADIDRSEEYPWDNVERLKAAGFFGMTIPHRLWRPWPELPRRDPRHRRNCEGLRHHRPHRRRSQHVAADRRDRRGLRYGGAEAARGGACARRRQARHLHHRARGRKRGDANDTRADRRKDGFVINGKKESRDHRRRRVAPPSGLRARLRRKRQAKRVSGGFLAYRDETKGLTIGKREPAMGLRGLPETEIIWRIWWLPTDALLATPRGLAHGFSDLDAGL